MQNEEQSSWLIFFPFSMFCFTQFKWSQGGKVRLFLLSLFLYFFFRSYFFLSIMKKLLLPFSTLFFCSVLFASSSPLLRHLLFRVCHLVFFCSSLTPSYSSKQEQTDKFKMKCRWQSIAECHLLHLPLVMFFLHIVYTIALAISLVLAILVIILVWLFHLSGMSYR